MIEAPAFIDGVRLSQTEWREVHSPYDGRLVGRVGWVSAEAATEAVSAAHAAMRRGGFPAHERAAVLQRACGLLDAHRTELASLISAEMGKPVRLAETEVARAATTLQLSADEARRLGGDVVAMEATATGAGHLGYVRRVPVGVVAAITPFNFPVNLAAHKVGPALAAGCAVVLKPADKAPLAASRMVELFVEAGLPDGWVNVVVGEPEQLAAVLAADERVGLITFTGSAAIGWGLREMAPRKRVSLELGNATPVIVDETADLAACAGPLALSAFGAAGQSCISVQRIYADERCVDELIELLAAETAKLSVGDPAAPETIVGPLVTAQSAQRVNRTVAAAVEGGGKLVAGGGFAGAVHDPTLVVDADVESPLLRAEIFGPVVAVQRVVDFPSAIAEANSTVYGLQAGVFTTRLDRAWQAAEGLEFAAVLINEVPTFRADQMPYGGIKESGNTREGPAYAIREMTEERLVVIRQ